MRMSDQTKLIPEIVKVETIKLESALNTEEVTMSDGFHRSLISLFRAESLMNAAQQSEISIMRAEVNCGLCQSNFCKGNFVS